MWELLEKLKTELSYDPAISLLEISLKECKSGYNKGTCICMFIAALFTIAKLWKQPRCPLLISALRKYDTYIPWNFIQAQRKMKFCCLQVNDGTGEHHLK
jgi:hypothetical protein